MSSTLHKSDDLSYSNGASVRYAHLTLKRVSNDTLPHATSILTLPWSASDSSLILMTLVSLTTSEKDSHPGKRESGAFSSYDET